jgi:TP901 family phage tail tape measure protein
VADLAELELRIKSTSAELARKRLEKLQARAKGFTSVSKRLERQTAQQDRAFGKFNSTAGRLVRTMGLLAGGFGAIAAARGAVRTIARFEESMATLRAVAVKTNQTLAVQEEQFKRLRATARTLGATTRFTASEAADGLLFLARAGFSVNEAIEAIPSTLDLASGGMLSLGEAADIASNVLRQFGLAASETERVVDALINTANNANTDVRQLAEALKLAGPVAGALGIEVEEATAAIGALGDAGIQASLAGTNMRGVTLALLNPTAKAQRAFRELGLTLNDIDPSMSSLIDVFNTFDEAIERTGGNAAKLFGAIFGRRNVAAALVLRNSVESMRDLLQVQEEGEGKAREQRKTIEDTLVGAFRTLKSAVQDATISMGDSGFLGALRGIVDFATDVVRELTGVEGEFKNSTEAVNAFIGAIAGLGAGIAIGAIVKLGFALQLMVLEIRTAATLTKGLFAVIGRHPLLLAATAVASLGAAYFAYTAKAKDATDATVAFYATASTTEIINRTAREIQDQEKAVRSLRMEFEEALARQNELMSRGDAGGQRGAAGASARRARAVATDRLAAATERLVQGEARLNDLRQDQTSFTVLRAQERFTDGVEAANRRFESRKGVVDDLTREIEKYRTIVGLAARQEKEISEAVGVTTDDLRKASQIWKDFKDLLTQANQEKERSQRLDGELPEEIQRIITAVELEADSLGKTNEERQRAIDLAEIERIARDELVTSVDELKERYLKASVAIEKWAEATRRAEEETRRFQQAADFLSNSFTDAFSAVLLQIDSLEDAFENLFKSIVAQALRAQLQNLFSGIVTSAAGTSVGKLLAGLFIPAAAGAVGGGGGGGAANTAAAAQAASGGNGLFSLPQGTGTLSLDFQKAAKGGIFGGGGVLTAPTAFRTGGTLGIAGEAGPEVAFAPLKRLPSGELGVGTVDDKPRVAQVNMTVVTQDADSFRRNRRQIMGDVKNGLFELR